MSKPPSEPLEERLRSAGRAFAYPPTPDLVSAVRQPRARHATASNLVQRRVALAVVLVLAGLFAVPGVRAELLRILRIGAIEILLPPPTPTAALPSSSTALPTPLATARPAPRPTVNAAILNLSGETTLEMARREVAFPIKLPTVPADLGAPDRVFVQNLDGDAVILVWLAPDDPKQVRLALYELESSVIGRKTQSKIVQETQVGNARAAWVEGPHFLQFNNGEEWRPAQLVTGNALLWTAGGTTYRLESGLSLDAALEIAESIR